MLELKSQRLGRREVARLNGSEKGALLVDEAENATHQHVIMLCVGDERIVTLAHALRPKRHRVDEGERPHRNIASKQPAERNNWLRLREKAAASGEGQKPWFSKINDRTKTTARQQDPL